ncbi:myocardin-related transcription factor A-like isoform X3 [Denticeps clupeoides]|uniref:SAP domain-containing protein n=2 Tax=Denticeps clupeoides TaxID=299321 RepID=A0A8C4B717_9TELE|nr:myocardin-related transcription factor A-like isoform X2 [Denticeps clupeoides]XP_028842774.1 myocardin-related transcription factor A-like isoform X3 [Denticeps clupeoides]
MDAPAEEEPTPCNIAQPAGPGSAPSPQSDAVTNELQELSLQPVPNLLPIHERKNVLQLKLQQRRTREELVSQGIMPPLKSPAAFHEQRRSLERARTEDYLKRKIRSRPERAELVRMHILEETSAEPSLQAKQLQLKRARLADDLNDKISHRPGPMDLIHKNILPIHSSIKQAIIETEFPKVAIGVENSSFDEDSSDALSPDQAISQDSPLGSAPLSSPTEALAFCGTSPAQVISNVPPPPPPPPPPPSTSVPSPSLNVSNGTAAQKPSPALIKTQAKSTSERSVQRAKKSKDSKPKVKKLKYHQYIPPDQKAEREPPPQLDSAYAKILHQQQLFLQLQIISQQQQHYNYHTILPAPPKPPAEQQPAPTNGPSPSRTTPTATSALSNQSGPSRPGIHPGLLPPNLDELKVAELKHELKLRGLPVSGTKNDLIERLRSLQEPHGTQKGGATTQPAAGGVPVVHQPPDAGVVVATFPFATTVPGGGAPAHVMHFGGSSSPPVSPATSDRSGAGMSPDEASCNGDAFGEMVTSPLTQLTLQPSPQHPSMVKEELSGPAAASCRFSRLSSTLTDKDLMLQEKDKQIEELTRMLLQKQRLVETLRSQLQQGRGDRPTDHVAVKEEPPDVPRCCVSPVEAVRITIKEEVMDEAEDGVKAVVPMPPQPKAQTKSMQMQLEILRLQQAQREKELQLANQQKQEQQTVLQQNQQNLQRRAHQRKKKQPQKVLQPPQPEAQQQLPSQQVFTNQQSGSAPAFPLDILKNHPAHTLVKDSNGNHFLIALTNHNAETPGPGSTQGKATNHVKLQRLLSTPGKLPSQAQSRAAHSKKAAGHPTKKGQKTGLHLPANHIQAAPTSISAPPTLQPFFPSTESTSSTNPTPSSPSQAGNVCPDLDQNVLFTPPSPKDSPGSPRGKENGSTQHMDDLFDILIQTGEIADPDPALSRLRPNTPPDPAAFSLSPPTPPESNTPAQPSDPQTSTQEVASGSEAVMGSGRLEDFLETTTGKPLLGVEPGGPPTLIDDLHSEMLSTSSILDHPPSPMDTFEAGYSPLPPAPGLDFGDPILDSMDWLDITMGGGGSEVPGVTGLSSHAPPSLFSTDFLDGPDLQLQWDSCL